MGANTKTASPEEVRRIAAAIDAAVVAVEQAVRDGRVAADSPSIRAAWGAAWLADSARAQAEIEALPVRPVVRPGSLNRALAAAALPSRPDVPRPVPVVAAAPARAGVSPVAAERALAAADGGAARAGRITGDEVRRRDAVIAAAVSAGKIPHQSAAGWRVRLDGDTAAAEQALNAASASQPAVMPSGSLQRALAGRGAA